MEEKKLIMWDGKQQRQQQSWQLEEKIRVDEKKKKKRNEIKKEKKSSRCILDHKKIKVYKKSWWNLRKTRDWPPKTKTKMEKNTRVWNGRW